MRHATLRLRSRYAQGERTTPVTPIGLAMTLCLIATCAAPALAQTYPSKPIELVSSTGAGGGSDLVCRLVAEIIGKEKLLPQPVYVVNKPGGGGAIGQTFGAEVPAIPGTAHSNAAALHSMFMHAGLQAIDCRTIDVTLAYADFGDFWDAQTPGYTPTTRIINAMSESERRRLKRAVQEALPSGPQGKIEYAARANAIRANVPA